MQEFMHVFLKADKPEWLTAPDFAVMVCLLSESTPEQPKTWVSIPTITQRTGVSRCSVHRAIATLEQERWITRRSGKRQHNTNLYEIMFVNLPTEQKPATVISEEARALAVWYRNMFLQRHASYTNPKGRKCRRPLRRDWRERWSYVIQTLLDAGNTPDFITRVFNWASKNHPKQFAAGPQGLLKIWPNKESK